MDAALQQDYNQPASLADGRVTKRQDILLGVGTVLYRKTDLKKDNQSQQSLISHQQSCQS